MKKCIVISDSFKGTLSSLEICGIARETVAEVFPDCQVVPVPVADGGEGTVACFVEAIGAEPVTADVTGPYGEPVQAVYARKGNLAVIEMAAAAGLPMVGQRKDPESTTTYGVGLLIRHAVESGCQEILLGLGGSATNDGGCGAAAALGVRFLDDDGREFVPVGKTLGRVAHIDVTAAKALLAGTNVTAMCDVENPLCGPSGASSVFGPQKGADPEMVKRLDQGLASLAAVIRRDLGLDLAGCPGAGAAGGMGAGCMAFFSGTLKSGIEAVLDIVGFDSLLEEADLVITGEGRIDSQSVHGKVISGIARRTSPRNVPLVAIVGCIDPSAEAAYDLGVTAMFNIDREVQTFEQLAPNSAVNYRRTLRDVLRLIRPWA
ncbi:glycerate kinase [uncultured Dysosmobacter sp.]|uniref:glycerate kinase family protein n=1 Tax=uncultured Dysosmobacter sp. TaxID=2591384 RepID=UPI00262485BF|nr:glycerate kinase [uncultured Dysosmobacter sp.]